MPQWEFGPDLDLDAAAVDVLAELAAGGAMLPLGKGARRVARALADRGLKVHGIERSEVDLGESFSLVFAVEDALASLLTQDEQVGWVESAGRRLSDGGVLAVGCPVPDLAAWADDQQVKVTSVSDDEVHLWMGRHDPVGQLVVGHEVVLGRDAVALSPGRARYVWPSELDLMAQLAGLRLRHRWGGWHREPFTGASARHVSVYEQGPVEA